MLLFVLTILVAGIIIIMDRSRGFEPAKKRNILLKKGIDILDIICYNIPL